MKSATDSVRTTSGSTPIESPATRTLAWRTPRRQVSRIGPEALHHEVAHDHGEAEGRQDRREGIGPRHHPIDHHGLQEIAQPEGDQDDRDEKASGGSHGIAPASDTATKALSTMNSPYEMLTTRMTPTMRASPTPSNP